MSYDTLYGIDDAFRPQPQMVDGHVVEEDARRSTPRLRGGPKFHDGEPVLARDVVVSLQRWGKVDARGQSLLAAPESLSMKMDFPLRLLRSELREGSGGGGGRQRGGRICAGIFGAG